MVLVHRQSIIRIKSRAERAAAKPSRRRQVGAGLLGASFPTLLQAVADLTHDEQAMGAVELVAAAAFAGLGLSLLWRQDEVDDRLSAFGEVVVEDLDDLKTIGIPGYAETLSTSSAPPPQTGE